MLSILATVTAGLTGCSSAGYTKGNAASRSFENAAAEVQAQSEDLDQTIGTLKQLITQPGPDLRKPFRRYSRHLDRFAASALRVEATGHLLEQKHAEYLRAWEQELSAIDFEHVRALSQARRAEVSQRFDAVHRRYQENQAVVQPMIAYFQDIRRALSTDLTPGGLQALKGTVAHADENAAKVRTALAALTAELVKSGNQLSYLSRPEPIRPAMPVGATLSQARH